MKNVSVVILSYNSLEDTTKPCLESIFKSRSNIDYGVVVVDNCSSDGTRDYLKAQEKQHPILKIILNDTNIGFAAGNNIGILAVDADYYILLNSDTIVTDYWLDRFVDFFNHHPEVGVIGPVTNSIGNEQRIYVTATNERDIIREGNSWAELCKGDFFYTNLIGFFCVAIKKDVFDKIGLLDEGFGLGMFEDDDFCYRTHKNQFKLACVEDLFIYHKGSISFSRLGYEITDLFYHNLKRYESKHNVNWKTSHNVRAFLKQIDHYNNQLNGENALKISTKIRNKLNLITNYINLDPPHPQAQMHLDQILGSGVWKLAQKYYKIRDTYKIVNLTIKSLKILGDEGVLTLFKKMIKRTLQIKRTDSVTKKLNKMHKYIAGKRVIVFPTPLDWNIPLFQRPQQLAKAYANKKNTVVLYFSDQHQYDQFDVVEPISNDLWLVSSKYITEVNGILRSAKEVIISISWTGNKRYLDLIQHDKLIYEYIDELALFTGYSEEMLEDHSRLLKKADVTVATANKLYEDIKNIAKNPILSTNAGDYDFFNGNKNAPVSDLISEQIKKYDCVLGYYGSMASWFDYDLVKEVANRKPNWLWVLIGWDYDGTLKDQGLLDFSNIIHIEAQHYSKLPSFLNAFDIATLPFKVNDITLSTSPVKIFEYMAGGIPVISANLPECLKYKSLFIYNNAEQFIENCSNIMNHVVKDQNYKDLLKKEALQNTWNSRTDQILKALSNN